MADTYSSGSGEANKALQDALDRNEPRILASYGLVGAILVLGGIGYAADRWMDTAPWLLLAGLLLGIVVGFVNLVLTSRVS